MPRLFMGIGVRIKWRTILLVLGVATTFGGPYVSKKWRQIKAQAQAVLAQEQRASRK